MREYPIGSQVSYRGQVFQLVSIENAQLNDLVRLELFNDSNQLFEENPILYLNSLEEIEQVLSLVELEKEDSEIEIESPSESQEIDLFSYLEEENEKIRIRIRNKTFNFRYRRDGSPRSRFCFSR